MPRPVSLLILSAIVAMSMGGEDSPISRAAAHFNMRFRGTTISTLGRFQLAVYIDLETLKSNLVTLLAVITRGEKLAPPGDDVKMANRRTLGRLQYQLAVTRSLGTTSQLLPMDGRKKREAGNFTEEEDFNVEDDPNGRGKRQIVEGALMGVKVVSTLWGLYQQYKLVKMRQTMEAQKQDISDLYLIADNHQSALSNHTLTINSMAAWAEKTDKRLGLYSDSAKWQALVEHYMTTCAAQISDAGLVMDLLNRQQLSHKALVKGSLDGLLARIRQEAATEGYQLLVSNAAEALQCQASYTATDRGYMAILHLPLAKFGDTMDIFQYISVPIPVTPDRHMTIHPKMEAVAVSRDKKYFRPMSLGELTMCDKLGSLHLCDNANLQTRHRAASDYQGQRNEQLCTWFIYDGQYDNIRKACKFHLERPTAQGFALSATEFVFVGVEPHQGTITCSGSNQISNSFPVNGITAVTVAPGCSAETPYFRATGGDPSMQEAARRALTWPNTLPVIWEAIDISLLNELEKEGTTPLPQELGALEDVLTRIKISRQARQASSSLGYVGWSLKILLTIGLVAAGVFIWYVRRTILRKMRLLMVQGMGKVLDGVEKLGVPMDIVRHILPAAAGLVASFGAAVNDDDRDQKPDSPLIRTIRPRSQVVHN